MLEAHERYTNMYGPREIINDISKKGRVSFIPMKLITRYKKCKSDKIHVTVRISLIALILERLAGVVKI